MKNRPSQERALAINKYCSCSTLDHNQLQSILSQEPLIGSYFTSDDISFSNLFSPTTFFISDEQFKQIELFIEAVEHLLATEKFKEVVLKRSPEIAQRDFGPRGAFMAYDFHLAETSPKLIEINTNAGGLLLNDKLSQAQVTCCADLQFKNSIGDSVVNMIISEWKLQRNNDELRTIVIVDDNPSEQFLYPEFLLTQSLLKSRGFTTYIADPGSLSLKGNKLYYGEQVVDLVYNRLTDFYLTHPKLSELRNAYSSNSVVLSPNPHHHAIYANKYNMSLLSNSDFINNSFIANQYKKLILKRVPKTTIVANQDQAELWNSRKQLFFKPAAGHGGKATYRGDKITKKVWECILSNEYVAQEIIPPSERLISVEGKSRNLKVDLRAYTYMGKVQLLAARLYSGQTTNFRTSGGGFAPVAVVD